MEVLVEGDGDLGAFPCPKCDKVPSFTSLPRLCPTLPYLSNTYNVRSLFFQIFTELVAQRLHLAILHSSNERKRVPDASSMLVADLLKKKRRMKKKAPIQKDPFEFVEEGETKAGNIFGRRDDDDE